MNSHLPFVCIQRLDFAFFDEFLHFDIHFHVCFAQGGIETQLVLRAQFSKRIEVWVQTFFTPFYNVFTVYLGPYEKSAMELLYKNS